MFQKMQPISTSVYLVGTGKTTLFHKLQAAFASKFPNRHLRPVTEVVRTVLQEHHFTRDDITSNPRYRNTSSLLHTGTADTYQHISIG